MSSLVLLRKLLSAWGINCFVFLVLDPNIYHQYRAKFDENLRSVITKNLFIVADEKLLEQKMTENGYRTIMQHKEKTH
jgi:hypothetical protein